MFLGGESFTLYMIQMYNVFHVSGGVDFWLKSIFTYARSPIPGFPKILLVGTHFDEMNHVCTVSKFLII